MLLTFAVILGSHSATAQDASATGLTVGATGISMKRRHPREHELRCCRGKTTATAPPTLPPRAPELVEFERLQKTLEETRSIAIMRPSEANVRRYMELESQVVARASYFADTAQRGALGYTATRSDPAGPPGQYPRPWKSSTRPSWWIVRAIADLGKDHVLFFFYRSDCPYCLGRAA